MGSTPVTKGPSIMEPFAVGALVPHRGDIVKIIGRLEDPVKGWWYNLSGDRTGNGSVRVEIPHAVILAEIGNQAHFAVGERVAMPGAPEVLKRKWSFRHGDVIYTLGD